MNLAIAQDAALEIRAIIKDFKPEGHPILEEFSDLCLYFLKKAKDRKFVRYTKLKTFDFYDFLETSMESESDQFKHYMLFLKKNQGFLVPEDFMKILTRFKVLSLPLCRDLELNPTASSLFFTRVSRLLRTDQAILRGELRAPDSDFQLPHRDARDQSSLD